MATLVLTAVGGAVAGPIGAALGAAVGGAVDRSVLFRPKGRQGPRLTDLQVQTSSYGTPIARVFGTMRVAGQVIWSTDLIEHASTSGGGKGGPSTTNYAYSASFAVLLSARAIRGVKRIWADGTLLRGAAGDFKVPVRFRLHLGDEAQAADPLIASAEELPKTPACRGQAYAVFEDLPLADYGNRIPSLTFEVEADAGSVGAGEVIAACSGGVIATEGTGALLGGYSAYGASVRDVAEGMAEATGGSFGETAAGLAFRSGDGEAREIVDAGWGGARGVRTVRAADGAPVRVALAHHDPARDYQIGVQRAARPGAGLREERVDLPAAIDAGIAKAMAAAALARADVEREARTVALDWSALEIAPGDRVTIAGEPGRWRVAGWLWDGMALKLDLVRLARASAVPGASSGRPLPARDEVAGATLLVAAELPPIDDQLLSAPRLTIAAAGTGAGWRRAALQLSLDGRVSWTPIGGTRGAAVLGTVVRPAEAVSGWLVDRRSVLEVELASERMVLRDADDARMDAGANLALVGDELVQFARAERIGARVWRLTELWRGRRGTEQIDVPTAGARFALLSAGTAMSVDLPLSTIGSSVRVMASGVGDVEPVSVEVPVTGASVRPPAPVYVRCEEGRLRWTRRSRLGWRWADGGDVPIAEESERYLVSVARDGAVEQIESSLPEIVVDGAVTGATVVQRGTLAPSRAAVASFG
jgi:hypothetical protein